MWHFQNACYKVPLHVCLVGSVTEKVDDLAYAVSDVIYMVSGELTSRLEKVPWASVYRQGYWFIAVLIAVHGDLFSLTQGEKKKSKGQHDPDSFSVDGTSILQLYPNGKERNWQKMFNKDPESGVERKKSSSRRGVELADPFCYVSLSLFSFIKMHRGCMKPIWSV